MLGREIEKERVWADRKRKTEGKSISGLKERERKWIEREKYRKWVGKRERKKKDNKRTDIERKNERECVSRKKKK